MKIERHQFERVSFQPSSAEAYYGRDGFAQLLADFSLREAIQGRHALSFGYRNGRVYIFVDIERTEALLKHIGLDA